MYANVISTSIKCEFIFDVFSSIDLYSFSLLSRNVGSESPINIVRKLNMQITLGPIM